MIMFFLLSALEDSGYVARMAYMVDRVFRIFGLHGVSVLPLIVSGGIAGGCAVPGVMATRTLRSPKEKLATILAAPFMTCGAKVPVFLMLAAAFFPEDGARVLFLITLGGWAAALLVARLLRSTVIKGESTPFVMELPPYRLPTLRGLCIHTWERSWQYIRKAGTVILAISILVWAAMTFPGLTEEQNKAFDDRIAAIEAQAEAAKAPEGAVAEAGEVQAQEGVPAGEPEQDKVAETPAPAGEPKALAQAETPAEAAPAEGADKAKDPLDEARKAVEAERSEEALRASLAGQAGQALEPLTTPAGFNWRVNIALLGGFAAKEVIVSTLATAYALGEVSAEEAEPLSKTLVADETFSAAAALSLMAFVLLYAPCMVTVAAIGKEAGWKWAAFSVLFNTVLAYAVSVAVFQAARVLI